MYKALRTAEAVSHEFQLVTTITARLQKLLLILLEAYLKKPIKKLRINFVVELGSGWKLKKTPEVEIIGEINYRDINMQVVLPSTLGHAGKLVFAKIKDQYVLFMLGRVHHYEGYEPHEVVRMVRALGILGAERFIFTNAAGGIEKTLRVGALMFTTDHLSGLPTPLAGHVGNFGPRHVPMGQIYSPELYQKFNQAHRRIFNSDIKYGVYASVPGPEFETPVLVEKLRKDGADAVGMSTTQQVTAIAQLNHGLRKRKKISIAAISLITNAAESGDGKISHSEVLKVGKKSAVTGLKLIIEVISSFEKDKK